MLNIFLTKLVKRNTITMYLQSERGNGMKYIAIVGTNASFSYNRKLLWYMKKHFNNQAQIEVVEITDVPLFCEDIEEIPTKVLEIARAIEEADGVIFSTPEYDHSITAGLKSLIEWLSWGSLHPLTNTPVMIVGVSLGNMGTVFAQENLRQILSSPGLDAFVLPSNQFLLGRAAESFNSRDELVDERTIGWLEHCFGNFVTYTKTLKPMRALATDRTGASSHTNQEEKVPLLEEGEGWWIEDTNLGFPVISDADTGASEYEEPDEAVKSAYAQILEEGDGWWIEEIGLHSGAKEDGATSASKSTHGKVADAKGQPDTSTGASEH